jgi:hypothetical protein
VQLIKIDKTFLRYFFHTVFFKQMGWATFWAIFFTSSPGHPDFNKCYPNPCDQIDSHVSPYWNKIFRNLSQAQAHRKMLE